MVQLFLQSILDGDRSVVARAENAPPGFLTELDRHWPSMSPASRDIAVLVLERIPSVPSANFLLKATADPALHVAAGAANALLRQPQLPAGNTIVNLIPSRPSPFVRGPLYLAAGLAGAALQPLRHVAANESDPTAALDALAAIARLGGLPERRALFERVRKARPDEVRPLARVLRYVGEPALAKAMLAWLASTAPVVRLGPDGSNIPYARMCDYAVWTAKDLGLPTPAGPVLANYEAVALARTRQILQELPDLPPDTVH